MKKTLLLTAAKIVLFAVTIVTVLLWRFTHYAPIDLEKVWHFTPGTSTLILDRHGKILTTFAQEQRKLIRLDQLSTSVIPAFLAAEDRYFFRHAGISWMSIIRSLWANITKRRIVQGGSTLTQQLVKLIYTRQERTYARKIKEIWFTWHLEQHLSKEQILQAYLNQVYCGAGFWGIYAACQGYFGCEPHELTLAQSATLAGLMQSPERLCPRTALDAARKRRNVILRRMHAFGFISEEELAIAQNEPLTVQQAPSNAIIPSIKEQVRVWLSKHFTYQQMYNDGLIVQTTLDCQLLTQAHTQLAALTKSLQKQYATSVEGGIMIIDGTSGAILAWTPGADPQTAFDRTRQATRQVGSIAKPLIYYAALEKGARLDDIIIDAPITLTMANNSSWSPKNYHKKYLGSVSRAYALMYSLNPGAVVTLLDATLPFVTSLLQQTGLCLEKPAEYPSLALGCIDSTIEQVIRYFNMFAHEGSTVTPFFVSWVKDAQGTIRYTKQHSSAKILSWKSVSQIGYTLVENGKRYHEQYPQPRLHNIPVMLKTGTTNDSRSCWGVAATPQITIACYLGSDDNKPLTGLYASRSAAPLCLSLLNEAVACYTHPRASFSWHPDLQEVSIAEPSKPSVHTKILVPTTDNIH